MKLNVREHFTKYIGIYVGTTILLCMAAAALCFNSWADKNRKTRCAESGGIYINSSSDGYGTCIIMKTEKS